MSLVSALFFTSFISFVFVDVRCVSNRRLLSGSMHYVDDIYRDNLEKAMKWKQKFDQDRTDLSKARKAAFYSKQAAEEFALLADDERERMMVPSIYYGLQVYHIEYLMEEMMSTLEHSIDDYMDAYQQNDQNKIDQHQKWAQHYRQRLESQMDLVLETCANLISTELFNKFLHLMTCVSLPINTEAMKLMDKFYTRAYELKVPFDVSTFSTLIRAIRMSMNADSSVCSQLLTLYCAEMQMMRIVVDAVTINEFLCIAAKDLHRLSWDEMNRNKEYADYYFNFYVEHLIGHPSCAMSIVLSSYLNVYAENGDFTGMMIVLNKAAAAGLGRGFFNAQVRKVFQKGIDKSNEKCGTNHTMSDMNMFKSYSSVFRV